MDQKLPESPEELKEIPEEQLPEVAQSLRNFLIESLNRSGGHFGAGLGTIELTLALHYVFESPQDKIIWDVGHQAYPHKILTGRKDQMHTIRAKDGLAPFPRREESVHDAFGVGHSSTSISAGLGMALGKHLKGDAKRVIAVIGDGSMTAGMAFEALNHAGDLGKDLIVILNDNDMSISRNVGALSNYFARILSGSLYTSVKAGSKKILERIPPVWELARRTESHIKGMVVPGSLFEELGCNYLGPIDGHNLDTLIKTLHNLKTSQGPQLLHVITKKGKGYAPAEADPIKYHAVSPGFLKPAAKKDTPRPPYHPTYSQVFGDWICDMAKKESRLVGITPAMREGSGLVRFAKEYPKQYYDVGIAEQHSITLAAGLACENLKPVVAIYSTFLQRGYDQLIHDVALQNLPVLFAIDRAGPVGDGPTHYGGFDLSFLRCIPNMTIMAPSDANECRHMLYTGFLNCGPTAVRYPRGQGPQVQLDTHMEAIPIGKAKVRREGRQLAIFAFGSMVATALKVADALEATVVDMRFIKPLDEHMILECAKTHEILVTLEENVIAGGAGSAVNEFILSKSLNNQVVNFGLPDHFLEHGSSSEILKGCGLDAQSLLDTLCKKFSLSPCKIQESSVESS